MRALMLAATLAIIVLVLTLPSPAQADEPMLAIRQAGGESAVCAVSEIERVVFEGDTLLVLRADGSDSYALASIARIEFLWRFSGVTNPEDAAHLLKALHLFQNQPNPFSPETRIAFDLPKAGQVELVIYGVDGRLIRWLVKDTREAGRHTASWDGRDDAGVKVGSGIYFYQLTAPGVEESRRMILLP
jgi:hypothetical protein